MPQPAEVEQLVEQLARLYRIALNELAEQAAAAALNPAAGRRRARLAELTRATEARMSTLRDDTARWIEGAYPRVYELGGQQGAASIGDEFAWSQPHVDAVRVLAQDTFDDVLEATSYVSSSTKAWVRREGSRQTALSLLEGRTAQQAARAFARQAQADGLLSVRYRDGSRHRLDDYADTLLRTKTAQAFNAGTLNHLGGAGVGYVEVLDGSDCGWTGHQDSDKANGSIRTLGEAAQWPLSHPRCRRSFIGRPELTSPAKAGEAGSLRPAEQMADQAEAEAERARQMAARRRARDRRARRAQRAQRQPRAPRARRSPRKAATGPSAAPRGVQTLTGRHYEPAAGKGRITDHVEFEGKADEVRGIIDRLNTVHGADPVGVTVVRGGKTKQLGGHYTPQARMATKPRLPSRRKFYGDPDGYRAAVDDYKTRLAEFRAATTRPQIRVNRSVHLDEPLTLAHEYGHHIDILGTTRSRIRETAVKMDPRLSVAEHATPEARFLAAARQTDAYRQTLRGPNSSYMTDPREVWARAYSQWAVKSFGDEGMQAGLRTLQGERFKGFQWADDEFEQLAPFVEDVLEGWGLMVRTG